MKISNATVNFFLDRRRQDKNNKFPLKLTIYFAGEKKRYSIGISISLDEWNKLKGTNLRDDYLKSLKRKIEANRKKAEDTINGLSDFTFIDFENLFFETISLKIGTTLTDLFNAYINNLKKNDQVGTYMSYGNTLNSLLAFRGNIKITSVDVLYLEEYEKYMTLLKKSPSTTGIYLRQLRRIINVAIKDGIYPANKYPFKGYRIPSSRNIKKALTIAQIKKLFEYQTDNLRIQRALDFWIFSYLSNGMNMADICHLKKTDIHGDFFSFFRAKTKNTKKRDLRPIKVPFLPKSLRIVERWGDKSKSIYLFPILKEGSTARQIKFMIQDFIKIINAEMKQVASDLNLNVEIGTYVARHSHSTILKRKGVSSDVIRENLGHSSTVTTENYLDDFTDEFKMENANKLMDF